MNNGGKLLSESYFNTVIATCGQHFHHSSNPYHIVLVAYVSEIFFVEILFWKLSNTMIMRCTDTFETSTQVRAAWERMDSFGWNSASNYHVKWVFNETSFYISFLFHGVSTLGRCTTPYVTCRWKRISIVLSRLKKISHGERFADK